MSTTVIDPVSYQGDRGILTIGQPGSARAWAQQVTECTLEPKTNRKDPIKVLSGGQVAGARSHTWTLKGKLLQDFGLAGDSLVEFCLTSAGATLNFEFLPDAESQRMLTGKLVIDPVAIGGTVGETQESDFEFDVVGIPTIVARD